MDRREAFKKIALIFGGVAIAPELLANALNPANNWRELLPAERLVLLAELAETIIPTTDTPGAKAAKTEEFIVAAVENCLPVGQRKRFWDGLTNAEEDCERLFKKSFVACDEKQRIQMMESWQAEAKTKKGDGPPFFTTLKMLTLHGYFTSEIGATQALNYDPIPGAWNPELKIDENTKAWTPVF
jgi:hypothetical protein